MPPRQSWQRLVVVGCMVQRYRRELIDEFPEVDAFIGVEDKESFMRIAWDCFNRRPERTPPHYKYKPRLLTTPPHLAYLRISDGCLNRCSYCVIPQIRGPLRSRPIDEITDEATSLVAGGARELVLVSQDTTSYGFDLYKRYALVDLLTQLEKIESLDWLRILYAHPNLVDHRLAHFFAVSKKLVPYLDIPIQHGDPEILKLMNRGSSEQPIRRTVNLIRSMRNPVTIRTTVITGFPGEKNQHFETMMRLLEELDFDRVGVFMYSREEGTPAAGFPGHMSDRIKEKRLPDID